MNKTELIDAIAAESGITKEEAKKALDSFTSNVTKALKKGGKVSLVGFGTFSTSIRSARNGINPQSKKTIKIAAKTVAKFKPSQNLLKGTGDGGPRSK